MRKRPMVPKRSSQDRGVSPSAEVSTGSSPGSCTVGALAVRKDWRVGSLFGSLIVWRVGRLISRRGRGVGSSGPISTGLGFSADFGFSANFGGSDGRPDFASDGTLAGATL